MNSRKQKEPGIDGVFDIETQDWSDFVVGSIKPVGSDNAIYWYDRESDYVDAILSFRGTLWAHNGGRFDALWLLSHILKRNLVGFDVVATGQRVLSISKGALIVRDSAALFPMKLDEASEIGKIRKAKTNLPCICSPAEKLRRKQFGRDESCGGYCSIRRDMSPELRLLVEQYLKTDCDCLESALLTFRDFCRDEGISLRGTVGSTAWNTARDKLGLPDAAWTSREYSFLEKAKHGGRSEVYNVGGGHVTATTQVYGYDICSAYSDALSNLALPIGEYRETFGRDSERLFRDGSAGIYDAVVEIPDSCHIPPLPVRTKDRIIYPVGTVAGVWAGNELAYATSIPGVEITSMGRAFTWEATKIVFHEYQEWLYDLRNRVGKKTGAGTMVKFIQNSFTGKLGQNPLRDVVVIDCKEEKFCPANGDCRNGALHEFTDAPCCRHRCTGKCGVWFPMDNNNRVWSRQIFRIAECAHIHWSCYLLGATRIKLHKMLVDDGQDGKLAVYCDTDSCRSLTNRTKNIGGELGMWEFEGIMRYWECWAPKTYRYFSDHCVCKVKNPTHTSGEWVYRAKGIPDAGYNWSVLRSGVKIDTGVETFRTALQEPDNFFRRKNMNRKVNPPEFRVGDRYLNPDGTTRPPRGMKGLP